MKTFFLTCLLVSACTEVERPIPIAREADVKAVVDLELDDLELDDTATTPARADCVCDSCVYGTSRTKLCESKYVNGSCSSFKFKVNLGKFKSCAAISANGGTAAGWDYYGGTHNCTLTGCQVAPP